MAQAPREPDRIVETQTATVEVLGLRQWTIAMLNDSLRKYEGYDLSTEGAHACAATLRYKLGFPDAAAIMLPGTPTKSYWVVTLVEPQDSNRVRYRKLPLDTTGGRPEWVEGRRRLKNRKDPAALEQWFSEHTTSTEYETALTVLQRDSNMLDRILAGRLAFQFLDHDDRAWTALAETLLESDGPVRGTGMQLLENAIASGKTPKDLNAIFPALHAVLDGSSQALMPEIIPLILALGPKESFAVPLLKNGGRMLLAHASAQHRLVRTSAIRLLAALSPKNYGRDIDQWTAWVRSL
jgi:hypothetical protein